MGTVGIAVWASREFQNMSDIEQASIGRDCRDGLENTWENDIVGWKVADVKKEINGGYCRGGCTLSQMVENETVLYWKLRCCCLTLREKWIL